MEKPRRDVEQLSGFGKPLSKGERNRDFGRLQDSQRVRDRILSEQKTYTTSLKGKLAKLFKEII